jgi:hypothetical protein
MNKRQKHYFPGLALIWVGLVVIAWANLANAQTFLTKQEASRVLVLENVTAQDGVVSGEIRNNSANVVRDVQLLIRYVWLWKNEFHPGKDDASRSDYYNMPGEIPPRGTTRFQYTPSSPLPKRTDGNFMVIVSVAGFTQVIPPGAGIAGSMP